MRALLVGAGVARLQGRPNPQEVRIQLHHTGAQGASTAITTGAVAGLLMIGLPLLFLAELGLQQQAAGFLGLVVVRVLGPTVAAAVVAGRMRISRDSRPPGVQTLAPVLAALQACAGLWVLTCLGGLLSGYGVASLLGGQSLLHFLRLFSQELALLDVLHGLSKAALFGGLVGVIRSHQALLRGQQHGALRAVLACLLLDACLNLPWLLGLL